MNLSPKAFSQSFDIQNKIFKVQNAQKTHHVEESCSLSQNKGM